MVPISICSASNPTAVIHKFVFDKKQTIVTLNDIKPDEWIKVSISKLDLFTVLA